MVIGNSKSHLQVAQKSTAIALLLFILVAVLHSFFWCPHKKELIAPFLEICCTVQSAPSADDNIYSTYSATMKGFCAFCHFLKAQMLLYVVIYSPWLSGIPNRITHRKCKIEATQYDWNPAFPRAPPYLVYS